MLTIEQGDIWAASGVLVVPVNCVGVAGAGMALAWKELCPEQYDAYRTHCLTAKLWPGDVVRIDNTILVATKDHWREPARPAAIHHGFLHLMTLVEDRPWYQSKKILIPALGCGRGGLSWALVRGLARDTLGRSEKIGARYHLYEPLSTAKDAAHATTGDAVGPHA